MSVTPIPSTRSEWVTPRLPARYFTEAEHAARLAHEEYHERVVIATVPTFFNGEPNGRAWCRIHNVERVKGRLMVTAEALDGKPFAWYGMDGNGWQATRTIVAAALQDVMLVENGMVIEYLGEVPPEMPEWAADEWGTEYVLRQHELRLEREGE